MTSPLNLSATCTVSRHLRHAVVGVFLAVISAQSLPAAELQPVVQKWLWAQTNLHTWRAEVIQTRILKTLSQPLRATGQVWFAAPQRFRWEIGTPPKTIAVRQPDQMLVIYPFLKRVERFPMGGNVSGPWKETMALFEAGFPRQTSDLQARFRVTSQSISKNTCHLTLEPKSAAARHMMPFIKLAFSTNDFMLRSTELQFADGSIMRNEFINPQVNLPLPDELFQPAIHADYEVAEPLKKNNTRSRP